MKLAYSAFALVAAAGLASAQTVYTDAENDLFQNNFANLDITQVTVNNDANFLYISVTTRGFESWTKYMMYFDTAAGGVSSNGWGRPVNLGDRQIDQYIGSWVDAPANNAQQWELDEGNWFQSGTLSNSVSGNTVTFTIPLSFFGSPAVGTTIFFDVATSGGGGGDPGVDHLSRGDQATSDWSVPSTAGAFLPYTIVPTPGAAALLGLGALAAGRRRR